MSFKQLISELKEEGKGLMSMEQYINVGYVAELLAPCNFLIFGLGEDAKVWQEINKNGRTVFLEDDQEWLQKFDPDKYEIHPVSYHTKVQDHLSVGFDPEKLKMELPESVTNTSWDLIFVDGPLGHQPPRPYAGPGRMQSIYTAHTLLKPGGICIVDDLGRQIESKYSSHFFGTGNLLNIVENKVGILKKS
tara:strand:- start:563 stop:1135 length:573 start_codon:yes stop_codon:yes gene_type:complete